MRQHKRLAKDEFDAAVKRLAGAMGKKGLDIARRVLVNGETQKAAADRHGVGAASASLYVKRIWTAHTESADLPPGLERITVVLPRDRAAIVLEWEKNEKIKRIQLEP